ncbi:unnamed protein product [Sphagnum troendelagicum]|uniref:Uncharacterized protein n=1 Tax=Sphagnum troendelagicum TaxID=128251 RepID=A0ABP0TY92_9BRYO
MFTSNGKVYCKRDVGAGGYDTRTAGMRRLAASRGYVDDLIGQCAGSRKSIREFDEDYLYAPGRKINRVFNQDPFAGKKSSGRHDFEEEEEDFLHRRAGRRIFQENGVSAHRRSHGTTRNGAWRPNCDVESLASEDRHIFGNLNQETFAAKKQQQESHGGGHAHQSFGNQLLSLRAALNDKELQLVELREQHISVVNRAAEARKNWEESLRSKDQVILQLQKALHHQKHALERREKESQDNLQTSVEQMQREHSEELEKKELQITLCEAKNAQFVQELVEQQKLIIKLKRQVEDTEKYCASNIHKLEVMKGNVKDLKMALEDKEEVAETKSEYCNELKTLLWKRDSMIAQLQLAEQQLQSTLAKQEAAFEALMVSFDKLQDEKAELEKKLFQIRSQFAALEGRTPRPSNFAGAHHNRKLTEIRADFGALENGASQGTRLKELGDKDGVLWRQNHQLQDLQQALHAKDIALSTKNSEQQQIMEERQRLVEVNDSLRREYEVVSRRNNILEANLASLQDQLHDGEMEVSLSDGSTPPVEVLPYKFFQDGSKFVEDLGVDDAGLGSVESERSNASVYHANFEKVEMVEIEVPTIKTTPPPLPPRRSPSPVVQESPELQPQQDLQPKPQQQPQPESATAPADNFIPSSEADNSFSSIQDEILNQEKRWRKTEELMRATLTRRMKVLEEAKEVHQLEENNHQDWYGRPHSGDIDNRLDHQMHTKVDSRLDCRKLYGQRSNAGHQTHCEEDKRLDLQQHIEQERNMDCSKRLERNGYRVNFEQESNRREYEQGIKFELRKYSNPKSYQKINSRLDNSGRYERIGHEGRYARGHRVRL